MLAKQCWRLLQNPNSLCARVLSAKYYPNGDILSAGPNKGSSYTCQSIVSGIQTFKRGCIWRVGTGSKIDIWQDPWIPTSENRRVITPRGATLLGKVEELIDPHTGQWDADLIGSVFSPVDVRRIMQIPLRVELLDDFVAWSATRSGTFSVKSAYHVEFQHQFGHQWLRQDGQGCMQINPIWKSAWRLCIPGKVKHFIWKVLKGVLPCFGVLAARHIPLSAQCPICKVGMEDIQHCLFTCSRAKKIWAELDFADEINRAVAQDRSGSVTMEILGRIEGAVGELPKAELFAVAAWYIWWQRRQIVKGETVQAPDRTALAIKVLCTNFVRSSSPKCPIRKRDHMWKKPTRGSVKVNVDASFCTNIMSGATGAVARDEKGDFIAAATWFLPHVCSQLI